MANILAIDSSTEACSVALQLSGKTYSRFEIAPRKHAELLLPMVNSLLKQANTELGNLDAIACSVGPGAFTGLRIAISVAQSLAYACKLPCIGISTLQLLAAQAFQQTEAEICFSAVDARMQEVYFAGYRRTEFGLPEILHPQQVIAPDKIALDHSLNLSLSKDNLSKPIASVAKVGSGWPEYQFTEQLDSITSVTDNILLPDIKMGLVLAQRQYDNKKLLKPESLQPVYLRNDVAKKKLVKN